MASNFGLNQALRMQGVLPDCFVRLSVPSFRYSEASRGEFQYRFTTSYNLASKSKFTNTRKGKYMQCKEVSSWNWLAFSIHVPGEPTVSSPCTIMYVLNVDLVERVNLEYSGRTLTAILASFLFIKISWRYLYKDRGTWIKVSRDKAALSLAANQVTYTLEYHLMSWRRRLVRTGARKNSIDSSKIEYRPTVDFNAQLIERKLPLKSYGQRFCLRRPSFRENGTLRFTQEKSKRTLNMLVEFQCWPWKFDPTPSLRQLVASSF